MDFLLITDPGLEDLAADELREARPEAVVREDPLGRPGPPRARLDAVEPLLALSTVEHVVEILAESAVSTLDDVRRAVREVHIPGLSKDTTFRVTGRLKGDHRFDRRQLEGAAGAAVQWRHRARVDLDGFDLHVRVDLDGARLLVGLQRNAVPLSKRLRRAKALRTSIKPTVAAAMVRLAGAHRGDGRLIDPLCGAGTIPVEAKRINPRLEVHACDWDRATAEVARGTVANHGLEIDVRVCDARSLARHYREPFDHIVTDPPYGVRLARQSGVARLYRELAPSWERVLAETGRIVVALVKFRTFVASLEGTGLEPIEERVVGDGELRPRLVVLARR